MQSAAHNKFSLFNRVFNYIIMLTFLHLPRVRQGMHDPLKRVYNYHYHDFIHSYFFDFSKRSQTVNTTTIIMCVYHNSMQEQLQHKGYLIYVVKLVGTCLISSI